ncbi:type VI secretion system contractile sheath large subunit [Neoroseomonas soli]|uniref:Type VI secretion system contractile sheath large subunit n=1 Tax=Neoroseomonas soli TaxID=1081025 RepID=A0A9X9X3V5_9PROT|nr:type VI secretion system contractile sheath large subunit [Neoroseomonas soli]MBR0674084.1 type VI secretion system contractile sheath large subunit [Neoroseomonas soli]
MPQGTETDPPAPLRALVLSGRFLGEGSGAAGAEGIAAFNAGTSAAECLNAWFGPRLADILAHDRSPAGRARAIARLEEAVDRDIAALDRLIGTQLDGVLHHERLRRLEGGWRALSWLVDRVPFGARIKIRVLTARWAEVCRDFERALEFDQSALFKMVYEGEFGTPGGEPFGMLLADYEVRHAPGPGSPTDDVAGLDGLAGVAAAAFAPAAIAAHPALLGFDTWAGLNAAADLTDVLKAADRTRWRALQGREDSRFLAVLLPRALARAPWPDDATRADGFRYREYAPDSAARVWMNAGYALASAAIRAFARAAWPADVRGAAVSREPAGGVIESLPAERLAGDPRDASLRPPVEVALTDDQERQAVEAGLIPFIGLEMLPEASFAATPSIHRPPRMNGETAAAANANQRLSAQFNAMLCVSRFAHCVKLMGRDMVGSFKTADDIQRRLQKWLQGFTNISGSAGDQGARFPLRDARVEVTEKPGQPGVYGCTILLQPHYQLDEVGAAFRLVTDLQAARQAA